MRCCKVLKGALIGGLVGFGVARLIWERRQSASEDEVYELRSVPSEQPAAPPASEVEPTEAVDVEAVVVVDTEAVDDSGTDVRTEVVEIDEISVDEAVEPDDLRVIEGIGPKISDILNENGIYTYAQLAGTDVDHLHSILADAGSRFRLADPTTWPQQALAAGGD